MAKKLGKKLAESNGDGGGTAVEDPPETAYQMGAKRIAEKNGKAEAPKKGRKPKQPMLSDDPAFEHIKEIENLAGDYVEARDRRQALLADEVDLKEKLMSSMKRHKRETYSFDGYMIEIVHEEETVKVKKKRAAKEDGGIA
jgi:hypothetical protein